jgi:hypothetical protein
MDKPPHLYENSDSDTESSKSYNSDDTSRPDFVDFAKRMNFSIQGSTEGYEDKPTLEFPSTFTTKVELPKTTDITTLFLIDSVNRDKNAFPQPTSFSLRLPRVYKNVKSIQLTEVKLLCSFYYFSVAKANIYLPIIERGRDSLTKYNGFPITKLITIREGTYSINDLLSEIQTELNYTPLFYDFPNGFTDFINSFSVSGDYSINFNQPGDTYYDSLNSKYITNPTMATIISYYWGSRYAGLSSYSLDQLKVAYYYPVLYEVLLDLNDKTVKPKLNLSAPPNYIATDGLPVGSHVIFNMSGINDEVAIYLINNNLDLLDTYRLNHTFRYSLVNRYQLSYDTNSLHVNIITTTLNTSLVNLINNTSAVTLSNIFTNNNLTPASYSNLQSVVSKATVIYADMFNFLQIQMAKLLGISYATYTPSFFNNLNNSIFFQNGVNAVGIRSNYDIEYLNSGQLAISSSQITYSDSPGYWPNLISSSGYVTTGLANINSPSSSIPYNMEGKKFQFDYLSIDPNTSYLNINKTTRTLDVLVNIQPAQYTILKFKSPVRQTLQVETLPLPYYYRYSDFNKLGLYKGVLDLSKNNIPQQYFDISYSYVYDISNSGMDIANYNPNILQASFGDSLSTSFENANTFTMNPLNNIYYFEFTCPSPEGLTGIPCVNNTNFSMISINELNISTLFTNVFSMTIYHDRGAFMADLGSSGSQNPLHYIATVSTFSTSSDLTIRLSTFSGHTYYTIFKSNSNLTSNNIFKPLVYYNNSSYTPLSTDYTNFNPDANPFLSTNLSKYLYVINYNKDFIRLPVTSTLMTINPSDSSFNTSLTIKGIPIGYDSNRVSNDLTDYIGYNQILKSVDPSSSLRIDPLNSYAFNFVTAFNSISQTYFGPNSLNLLLSPNQNTTYSFTGTSTSQLKIVQWYEGFSVPLQLDDQISNTSNLGILQTSSLSQVLTSFPRDKQNNIVFGRGINAIGFLPVDGVYKVNTFSFKSSFYPLTGSVASSNDPNLQIQYIGVFSGLAMINTALTLSSSISVLKFDTSIAYGPNTLATGFSYGTWYNYINDNTFISSNNNVSGNTRQASELLSYDSLFYMLPFNKNGILLTYSALSGSILPYPLAQIPLFSTSYFSSQIAINTPGSPSQPGYILPISNTSSSKYGPSALYSQTQSQYEQSMPITTPSIGYKETRLIVNETNALYKFNTTPIVGLTTYFSEFSDSLYIANSTSNVCSNTEISFPTLTYLSSLSSIINNNSGNISSIHYLLNPALTLQNYTVQGTQIINTPFIFSEMPGDDSNITIKSFELKNNMNNLTLRMWGGGGGSLSSLSTSTGGAGAYVKVSIDAEALLNTRTHDSPDGISTLYIVVGKGGNLDNFKIQDTIGSLQLYEQIRYGGGGTSLTDKFVNANSITSQGGGFSGIFAGSNILTATPLLIVGGGGAAGTTNNNLGGPGGFGITDPILSTITYNSSSVTFDGLFYNRLPVYSVKDVFNNTILNRIAVNNTIDNNILTSWNPNIPSIMNPFNYFPTPNTYGLSLFFSTPITSLSKIRFYGPMEPNVINLPTGIIVFNDINKHQILYSNTSIKSSDYQVLDNYQIYDIILTSQLVNTPIQSNAWIVGGTNASDAVIQYSLDSINWVPINNKILPVVKSLQYISIFNKWYASGNGIIFSSDGINWQRCVINNYFSSTINTIVYGNSILVAGAENGSMYFCSNGLLWNSIGNIFRSPVYRIRFINGVFWGLGGVFLKKSVNGITWTGPTVNFTLSSMTDIAYGAGYYVITQANGRQGDPLISGIIYSADGISWQSTNIENFSGTSVVYENNIFVACGISTDSTSSIKYSYDGFTWFNSNFSGNGELQRNDIQFSGNKFICVGKSLPGTGLTANQVSIVTSLDGIDWSYSQTGGFNPDLGTYGANSSAYGPVTILPNMSTIYIEIQKTTFITHEPKINEIRVYDTVTPIPVNTAPLIDTDISTIFHPPEAFTVDVINYPFIFTFSSPPPLLNYIQIFTPSDPAAQFTGIEIGLDSSNIIYSNFNILNNSTIQYNSIIYNVYNIFLIPSLANISTLYINIIKETAGSIQIAGINGLYDPNMQIIKKSPSLIQDINNRFSASSISNIIDDSISTFWRPNTFIQGDSLKFSFTFSQIIDRINNIKIVNGNYSPNSDYLITGIGIYTNSTKSTVLYYNNTSIIFNNYLSYSIIDINISPYYNFNTIYIEFYKNTPGIPIINAVEFFNIGSILNTPSGYSGGQNIIMTRSSTAFTLYDGGGGTISSGGNAGNQAEVGSYLKGGSPAVLITNTSQSNILNLQVSAGGGGGGYFGGGGGGALLNGIGGAGGGGSGYILDTSIFTILDYGVAIPGINNSITNYISPGTSEQDLLSLNKVIIPPTIYYGQGGYPTINSGSGAHGLVVFSYDQTVIINPTNTSDSIIPSFIDGSKLTIFQAPIQYITNDRILSFTPFLDSIQLSQYSDYNWVWYRSYLSLVGNKLLTSMIPSTMVTMPPPDFPNLPTPIYAQLSEPELFSTINYAFSNKMPEFAITNIINSMNSIFTLFQNIYFIQTPYTDSVYYEFTEIYSLLDYLRNPVNLANPHVNPSNPTLDRIFGGIPRFGYWANPFFTNVSYIGFDVALGQIPIPSLSTIAKNGNPVQAMYGLVLEQSLSTGAYEFKDIMAYKPTYNDSITNGSPWLTVTQFPEAYTVRNLTNTYIDSNVIVQPYTFKNALTARLPLFNYSVYSIPATIRSKIYDIPVQIIHDFEGQHINMYSFQNNIISDISSINLNNVPFTSTMMYINQKNINNNSYLNNIIIGTLVSEYQSTVVNVITSFRFDTVTFKPLLTYSTNFYNTFVSTPQILSNQVGKSLFDYNGNYYLTQNNGSNILYENVDSTIIRPQAFEFSTINYASPKFILTQYTSGIETPYSDFFVSKFTNIWHFSANDTSSFYGARLTSPYDLTITTSFANQVFYPTHKISLIKTGSLQNPITNPGDTQTYPSYQHTNMFFYNNFSSLVNDISGQFAMEKAKNFTHSDLFSGYDFHSFINNINLNVSNTSNDPDSFYYLAIRGYSPTEKFQSLVRFYLPQRYDYGYISLLDLSNEPQIIANNTNVNPDYKSLLGLFNAAFSTTRTYGSVGIPGFSGSNITTNSFGDFLNVFNKINIVNNSNNAILSTVIGQSNAGVYSLITGDLQYILPSYLALRNRITDPVEFSIPFSSCIPLANIGNPQYGLGYNLGFALQDTDHNTVQRGTSFFKILDDYIYLQMNEEFNMNRMGISKPENFARTRDTTAQSGVYNSKLMLNNFGSFATTFVHGPVTFNPTIGKIDKLSFSWYNSAGVLLNNTDCEWSGSVQIVEAVNTA